MRLWYWLGWASSPLVVLLLGIYNRIHPTIRPRIAVFDPSGRLLLIRNAIGVREWELPGGGVKRDEDPAVAVQRELLEETGVKINVQSMHYIKNTYIRNYTSPLYITTLNHEVSVSPNRWEIVEYGWFNPDNPPASIGPAVHEIIQNHNNKR